MKHYRFWLLLRNKKYLLAVKISTGQRTGLLNISRTLTTSIKNAAFHHTNWLRVSLLLEYMIYIHFNIGIKHWLSKKKKKKKKKILRCYPPLKKKKKKKKKKKS